MESDGLLANKPPIFSGLVESERIPKHSAENLTRRKEDRMSRKGTLLIIAGIVLIAVIAAIVKLQGTKQQRLLDGAAGTAQTAADRRPF